MAGKARGAQLAAVASSVLSSGVLFGTVAGLTPSKRGFDRRRTGRPTATGGKQCT
jgi:hypothetical protein